MWHWWKGHTKHAQHQWSCVKILDGNEKSTLSLNPQCPSLDAMGRTRDWSREMLSGSWKPHKSLSDHCCFLAKPLLTMSFDDQDCFAQCLTWTSVIWNPLWGEQDQKHHYKASIKRDASKKHIRRTRNLAPNHFLQKGKLWVEPSRLWVTASQPRSRQEEGGWPHRSLFEMINSVLKVFWRWLTALLSQPASRTMQSVRVKVSATDHQAFSADEKSVTCWVVQFVSVTSPVSHCFGEKKPNKTKPPKTTTKTIRKISKFLNRN